MNHFILKVSSHTRLGNGFLLHDSPTHNFICISYFSICVAYPFHRFHFPRQISLDV